MGEPVIHHRSPDFKIVFAEALSRLQQLFRTEARFSSSPLPGRVHSNRRLSISSRRVKRFSPCHMGRSARAGRRWPERSERPMRDSDTERDDDGHSKGPEAVKTRTSLSGRL